MPLAFVIVLSVFLIASVVTIVNSIDLTVLTIYNYTKVFTPVLPRSIQPRVPEDIQAQLHKTPGVDRMIETSDSSLTSTRFSVNCRLSALG